MYNISMFFVLFFCVIFCCASNLQARIRQTHFFNISEHIETAPHKALTDREREILNLPLDMKNERLPEWMLENIHTELKPFERFSPEQLEEFYFNTEGVLLHFRIRNNKLFCRVNNAEFNSTVREFGCFLYKIISSPGFQIDSGDYMINWLDGVEDETSQYPIFCFSKNEKSNYVNIPDWFALSPEHARTIIEIDRASQRFPWEKKINKAFWIGNANGRFSEADWKSSPRSKLVFFSLQYPDLVWARLSLEKNERAPNQELESLRNVMCHRRIPISRACKYKYLIDVDGHSSSFYRPQWILRSNCVMIKQNSRNFQWFYAGMKPYIHYIPYETDCSDLQEVVDYLKHNDKVAHTIALEGINFARQNLNTSMNYLYLYHLLLEQNKLNTMH